MSPQWASVGSYTLWFYFNENHERPHVAVRQGRSRVANVDVVTGEVLAGTVPPKVLREIQQLLADHQDEALEAFDRALRHELPGRLGAERSTDDQAP